MLNIFLQSEAEKLENLIVPDSVQKARFAETVSFSIIYGDKWPIGLFGQA